jgi:hypothetical protein
LIDFEHGGGGNIMYVLNMWAPQVGFFLNWKLIVKIKSCWSQYTNICNMLVHFF